MRLVLLALVLLGAVPHASAEDGEDGEPGMLVMRVGPDAPIARRHVVRELTPAMRVWVLRGSGPARARVLAPLSITLSGDADDAIDALQERAFALHADAVVHVRVEHGPHGEVVVHGTAVRFG